MLLCRSVRSVLFLSLFASVLPAQQDRITTAIDARRSVVVRGSVSPQARPEFDRGAVEPDFRLGNITLMLRPSAAQQAGLERALFAGDERVERAKRIGVVGGVEQPVHRASRRRAGTGTAGRGDRDTNAAPDEAEHDDNDNDVADPVGAPPLRGRRLLADAPGGR